MTEADAGDHVGTSSLPTATLKGEVDRLGQARLGVDAYGLARNARLRTLRAAQQLGARIVRALPGGESSIVALADVNGTPAVIKAPLDQEHTKIELKALELLPTTPHVLKHYDGVLVLEYIAGEQPHYRDASASAALIEVLHASAASAADSIVHTELEWGARTAQFIERAADAVNRRPGHPLAPWSASVAALGATLASGGDAHLCHGDLHSGNIIVSDQGPRLVDPLPVLAPAGWDSAIAAAHVVAHGGNPTPILNATARLGIDTTPWLAVAAVTIGGTSGWLNHEQAARALAQLAKHTR